MNTKTLQLLSQKKQGVEVVLFTENRQMVHSVIDGLLMGEDKETL